MKRPLHLLIAPEPSRPLGREGPGIQPGLVGSLPLSVAAMVLAHPERPRAAEQPAKLDPLCGAWTFQPAHSGSALLDSPGTIGISPITLRRDLGTTPALSRCIRRPLIG